MTAFYSRLFSKMSLRLSVFVALLVGIIYLPHITLAQQTGNDARAGRADGVAGCGELRVIEGVEQLDLELMLKAFVEARHLDQRKVYVGLSRRTQDVAARVAVSTGEVRSHLECSQVVPFVNRRIAQDA